MTRVAVVGAGISGAACAAALRSASVEVEVFERARAVGGRLASPEVHGRRVDLGAAYLTVTDPLFGDVVSGWASTGLAREWTDTFDAFSTDGHRTTGGPMRWAAPGGLRTLARNLHGEVGLAHQVETVGELPHDAVVLAMPDPQARRLLAGIEDTIGIASDVEYEPVIAVAAGWPQRCWPMRAAAFVNDDPDISFVADDGSRRGDGAPVLVSHTTADRARQHLDAPDGAVGPVLAALRRVLGVDAQPDWTHPHRWTFAKPAGTHGDQPFAAAAAGSRLLGFCGDSWCPQGSPRVESAWLSGHRLGLALADLLA